MEPHDRRTFLLGSAALLTGSASAGAQPPTPPPDRTTVFQFTVAPLKGAEKYKQVLLILNGKVVECAVPLPTADHWQASFGPTGVPATGTGAVFATGDMGTIHEYMGVSIS